MDTTWRSRGGAAAAKGKKRMLGIMTDFLKPNKRPEISTPREPLHLTHVGFDSSTRKFTGLPKDWQRLEDSGVSKSAQEKDPLGVMGAVKFHQEGGGDVRVRMGHSPAPGSSRALAIPGASHGTYGMVKSVDDSFLTVSAFFCGSPYSSSHLTSNQPALLSPKNSHTSDDPQSVSPSHLPASNRPATSPLWPAQRNFEKLNSQPHSDTLILRFTTKDQYFPGPPFFFFAKFFGYWALKLETTIC
jgi:p21-activated kinase 1